mmetsp:Transcript_16824/g.33502  ORF Transcript_16824/g.33502 Transcript_16824/m.33502 type:complete len:90 (-) Transcript_16824:51-320(-)
MVLIITHADILQRSTKDLKRSIHEFTNFENIYKRKFPLLYALRSKNIYTSRPSDISQPRAYTGHPKNQYLGYLAHNSQIRKILLKNLIK